MQHLVGKAMWQMIFANDDLDINAEIVFVAQDFYDTTAWILRRGWPVRDLDVDDHVFEISPVAAVCGFFAENAMLGRTRRWSLVVGRRQNPFALRRMFLRPLCTGLCAVRFCQRPTTDDRGRIFWIFHSLRNHNFMRNL